MQDPLSQMLRGRIVGRCDYEHGESRGVLAVKVLVEKPTMSSAESGSLSTVCLMSLRRFLIEASRLSRSRMSSRSSHP